MSWRGALFRCALLFLLVNSASCSITYSRTKLYNDEVVVTCMNKNDRRVQIMMNNAAADVWKVHQSGMVEMRLNRYTYGNIQRFVRDVCYVSIHDVEAYVQAAEAEIDNSNSQLATGQELGMDQWFNQYHDLDSIYNWYKKLSDDNSHLVKINDSIGTTHEGRNIMAVHITDTEINKPKFYFQCLIHAREWITGPVCMYLAQSLIKGHKEGSRNLLKDMEFVIVPVVNPDGYAYTWTANRLWRKNRATSKTQPCVGVDLNRNFPVGWEQPKDISLSCSQTYAGVKKASELETQAIITHYMSNGPFVAAIDFHSYGQLILRPWGFDDRRDNNNEAEMASIGNQLSQKIHEVHGKQYISQRSIDLYRAPGIASDWFFSKDANKGNNPFVYTIELRDHGRHGFLLKPDEILPTCEEIQKAFFELADIVATDHQSSSITN